MEKCDCWIKGVYNFPYCNGTKEQDPCKCGGDRSKCDFYAEVRQKAKAELENSPLPVPEGTKLSGFGPSKNGYRYDIFEWVAFSVDQPKALPGIEYKILFCYTTPSNDIGMNICSIGENDAEFLKHILDTDNLLYWCYIQPPKHLVDKQAAIKRLQSCGILDENGDLVEVYKDILIKVEDL